MAPVLQQGGLEFQVKGRLAEPGLRMQVEVVVVLVPWAVQPQVPQVEQVAQEPLLL